MRFSCIAYLFNFKGMEPKGFRCPMPCENANNATYADIPEEWMFPYDSETEEYDYCNPYKFDESMINKPCQNDSFIMEEEKFDIELFQAKGGAILGHVTKSKITIDDNDGKKLYFNLT